MRRATRRIGSFASAVTSRSDATSADQTVSGSASSARERATSRSDTTLTVPSPCCTTATPMSAAARTAATSRNVSFSSIVTGGLVTISPTGSSTLTGPGSLNGDIVHLAGEQARGRARPSGDSGGARLAWCDGSVDPLHRDLLGLDLLTVDRETHLEDPVLVGRLDVGLVDVGRERDRPREAAVAELAAVS